MCAKKASSGIRDDLGIYFRSSWEANYARYLNHLKRIGKIINWEYEVDEFCFESIKRGTRFYKPDFKVWVTEGVFFYVEVKGYLDNKSKVQLKRMKKYYPSVTIKLVDRKEYKKVCIYAKQNSISNWE